MYVSYTCRPLTRAGPDLEILILVFKAEGRGRPPGDHKGQLPSTGFGLSAGIWSSNNTARTPQASLVWGNTGPRRQAVQLQGRFVVLGLYH